MSWKNVKEHYRIGHIVQITEKGICVGSAYIHDLIIIGMDGAIIKGNDGRANEDLGRYMKEFGADPQKLSELIKAPDTFQKSLPVYTYDGANIVEKSCEEYGWPNVTHDGCIMHDNMFSKDKAKIVKAAKKDAQCGIDWRTRRILEMVKNMAELKADMDVCASNLEKLQTDFPE